MDLRIISLDIETANLDMEAEGLVFDDPKGWRTAVVCVHNAKRNSTATYVHPDMMDKVAEEGGYANLYPFPMLEYHLRAKRKRGLHTFDSQWIGF